MQRGLLACIKVGPDKRGVAACPRTFGKGCYVFRLGRSDWLEEAVAFVLCKVVVKQSMGGVCSAVVVVHTGGRYLGISQKCLLQETRSALCL